MSDILDQEGDLGTSSSQLEALKRKADNMGVKYSSKIGIDALREKINRAMSDEPEEVDEAEAEPGAQPKLTINQLRAIQEKEELRLVRFRISCLNPMKKEWPGEVICVGNDVIGIQKKFIPYGTESEEGWHACQMIFRQLRKRKFLQVKTRTVQGKIHVETKYVPEFAIEELPQLTDVELKELARIQAAAQGRDAV